MTLWLFRLSPHHPPIFPGYSCAKPHRERPCYPFLGNGLFGLHFSKWSISLNYYLGSLRWWVLSAILPHWPSSGSWPCGAIINHLHCSAGQSLKLASFWLSMELQHTVASYFVNLWLTEVSSFPCSEFVHCNIVFAVEYFRALHLPFMEVWFSILPLLGFLRTIHLIVILC